MASNCLFANIKNKNTQYCKNLICQIDTQYNDYIFSDTLLSKLLGLEPPGTRLTKLKQGTKSV